MLPTLHASDIANYEWNSHFVRFSFLAPAERQDPMRTMVALAQSRADWTDARGFRIRAALIHEIVHYYQDLLTGVGTWDFYAWQMHMPEILGLIFEANENKTETVLFDIVMDLARSSYSDFRQSLLLTDEYPLQRRRALLGSLSQLIGKEITGDQMPAFVLPNLLEAEAAAITFLSLTGLKMTKSQRDIMNDNASVWHPTFLPDKYTATLHEFFGGYAHWVGELPDDMSRGYICAGMIILCFLIDCSCAYPPPSYFEASGIARDEFEPGLKFGRLFASMQTLSRPGTETFQRCLLENDYEKAEQILLSNCGVNYPRSQSIFADWARVLEAESQRNDDRVLRVRYANCQARADKIKVGFKKSLDLTLCEHKCQIVYASPTGLHVHGMSPSFFDPEEHKMYQIDLLRFERDRKFCDYRLANQPFCCALAETKLCRNRRDICSSGIESESQFPASHLCYVRDEYEKAGYHFED